MQHIGITCLHGIRNLCSLELCIHGKRQLASITSHMPTCRIKLGFITLPPQKKTKNNCSFWWFYFELPQNSNDIVWIYGLPARVTTRNIIIFEYSSLYTPPKLTTNAPETRPFTGLLAKRKPDCLPSIHFQVRFASVSGSA